MVREEPLARFCDGELVNDPQPGAIGLTPGNLRSDVPAANARRRECKIRTAERGSLNARCPLRTADQEPYEELSNLLMPAHYLAVATRDHGIHFIERDEPFDIASIGTRYE